MQISGEWFECEDGIIRPTVVADLRLATDLLRGVRFVVDTAADRTVLSAALLPELPSPSAPPEGARLAGIGGSAAFGTTEVGLAFSKENGQPVLVRGEFAVFTQPEASDLSVLGRDVTDLFDVIVSRRYNTVLLLAGNHRFDVAGV